jgi:predicted O-methyltransferase YrrM
MTELLPDATVRFLRAVGPEPDDVLAEMESHGEDFPTVGHEVGGFLRFVARTVDAETIFEFGSGFGYSAYWFARALAEDGEVILTEVDEGELRKAREFFERGGMADRAVFEHGDAVEIVEDYDGPFDVVLIDNEKRDYPDAFEAVAGKVRPGGVVIADNAMTSTVQDFDAILAAMEGDDLNDGDVPGDVDRETRGVIEYLRRVREDPDWETVALPLGEGTAVSVKL